MSGFFIGLAVVHSKIWFWALFGLRWLIYGQSLKQIQSDVQISRSAWEAHAFCFPSQVELESWLGRWSDALQLDDVTFSFMALSCTPVLLPPERSHTSWSFRTHFHRFTCSCPSEWSFPGSRSLRPVSQCTARPKRGRSGNPRRWSRLKEDACRKGWAIVCFLFFFNS